MNIFRSIVIFVYQFWHAYTQKKPRTLGKQCLFNDLFKKTEYTYTKTWK